MKHIEQTKKKYQKFAKNRGGCIIVFKKIKKEKKKDENWSNRKRRRWD